MFLGCLEGFVARCLSHTAGSLKPGYTSMITLAYLPSWISAWLAVSPLSAFSPRFGAHASPFRLSLSLTLLPSFHSSTSAGASRLPTPSAQERTRLDGTTCRHFSTTTSPSALWPSPSSSSYSPPSLLHSTTACSKISDRWRPLWANSVLTLPPE